MLLYGDPVLHPWKLPLLAVAPDVSNGLWSVPGNGQHSDILWTMVIIMVVEYKLQASSNHSNEVLDVEWKSI